MCAPAQMFYVRRASFVRMWLDKGKGAAHVRSPRTNGPKNQKKCALYRSLNVIIPPSYLDLVSSFAIGHPPFNNTWMSMKLEETLKTHHSFVKVRSNPWMTGRLGVKTCSVRSEIAHRRLGAKSFMNCLNESAGSEKWSDRFLLFYFSIICYAQYLRGSEHSPSLFSGVVRIRGSCWMPLLMNYVGVLMRFISTSHGIRYLE